MRHRIQGAAASFIAVAAAIGAYPAYAQETTVAPQPATQAETAGFGDIIVTAQRREERNQEVPISITAFSGERLQQQNITTGQDLNNIVPSLQVGTAGQASRDVEAYTLRGQGATYQGSSAVVVYLNEVPLIQGFTTAQQGGPGNYVDLENVQVLAGPQGTLFGRNTTGGAVLLVPKKPTNAFEGYIQGSVGNYDYVGAEGAINVPLVSDQLMIRASGTYQDRDGFTEDVIWNKHRDDLHYYAGRIGITFKPSERFENYLMVFGAKSRNNGTGYIHRGWNIPGLIGLGFCQEGPTVPGVIASCDVYRRQTELADELGPRKTRNGVDGFERTSTWGIINTTDLELTDELTLRNIVSLQRYKKDFSYDHDATPIQQSDVGPGRLPDFPVPGLAEFGIATGGYQNEKASGTRDNLKQVTEELQLQGNLLDNHLTFTVGGFYYKQDPTGTQFSTAVPFCPAVFTGSAAVCGANTQIYAVTSKSKALYGQGTLDLGAFSPSLEKLRLTAGYRYTWDTIKGASTFFLPLGPGSFLCLNTITVEATPEACTFGDTLKTKAPTWRFGVDYQPMSNLMLFANVSRGYKAGGFNPYSVRPSTRTFDPEKVTSYEAGFKSDWNLGSVPLRLNVTAYTMDYANVQRTAGDANGLALGATIVPASARIRGVEAEASIRPVRGVEIGGNLSYIDAKWKEFTYTALGTSEGCNGTVAPGGLVDASCTDFGVPKWSFSVHASVDAPVPEEWGKLNFYANFSWVGENDLSAPRFPADQPGSIFDSYGLLNLSINWRNIGQSPFDATLFMNNATDKLYKIGFTNVFHLPGGTGGWAENYGEPRMYGLRLRYRFGQ